MKRSPQRAKKFEKALKDANIPTDDIVHTDCSSEFTSEDYAIMRQEMDALTLDEATDPVNPVCPILSPIVDVRTRWNSKLYMLRRAKLLAAGFKLIAAVEEDLREFELNTADWGNVDEAIDFLDPFDVTRVLNCNILNIMAGQIVIERT